MDVKSTSKRIEAQIEQQVQLQLQLANQKSSRSFKSSSSNSNLVRGDKNKQTSQKTTNDFCSDRKVDLEPSKSNSISILSSSSNSNSQQSQEQTRKSNSSKVRDSIGKLESNLIQTSGHQSRSNLTSRPQANHNQSETNPNPDPDLNPNPNSNWTSSKTKLDSTDKLDQPKPKQKQKQKANSFLYAFESEQKVDLDDKNKHNSNSNSNLPSKSREQTRIHVHSHNHNHNHNQVNHSQKHIHTHSHTQSKSRSRSKPSEPQTDLQPQAHNYNVLVNYAKHQFSLDQPAGSAPVLLEHEDTSIELFDEETRDDEQLNLHKAHQLLCSRQSHPKHICGFDANNHRLKLEHIASQHSPGDQLNPQRLYLATLEAHKFVGDLQLAGKTLGSASPTSRYNSTTEIVLDSNALVEQNYATATTTATTTATPTTTTTTSTASDSNSSCERPLDQQHLSGAKTRNQRRHLRRHSRKPPQQPRGHLAGAFLSLVALLGFGGHTRVERRHIKSELSRKRRKRAQRDADSSSRGFELRQPSELSLQSKLIFQPPGLGEAASGTMFAHQHQPQYHYHQGNVHNQQQQYYSASNSTGSHLGASMSTLAPVRPGYLHSYHLKHNHHAHNQMSSDSSMASSRLARFGSSLRSCCSKKCAIVSVMVGIMLVLVLVAGLSAYLNHLISVTKTNSVPLSGRFKIDTSGDSFQEQLANKSSLEFALKQRQYETILRGAFDRSQTQLASFATHMSKCEVYGFQAGSLWVYFRLFVNKRTLLKDSQLMRLRSSEEPVERHFLPRLARQTLQSGFESLMVTTSLSSKLQSNFNERRSRSSNSNTKAQLAQLDSSNVKSFDEQISRLMPMIESLDLQSIEISPEFDIMLSQQVNSQPPESMSDNLRASQGFVAPSAPTVTPTVASSGRSRLQVAEVPISPTSDEVSVSTKVFTLTGYKENSTRPATSATSTSTSASSTPTSTTTIAPPASSSSRHWRPSAQVDSQTESIFLANRRPPTSSIPVSITVAEMSTNRPPATNQQTNDDKLIKLKSGQPVTSQAGQPEANLAKSIASVFDRVSPKTYANQVNDSIVRIFESIKPTPKQDTSIQDLWSSAFSSTPKAKSSTLKADTSELAEELDRTGHNSSLRLTTPSTPEVERAITSNSSSIAAQPDSSLGREQAFSSTTTQPPSSSSTTQTSSTASTTIGSVATQRPTKPAVGSNSSTSRPSNSTSMSTSSRVKPAKLDVSRRPQASRNSTASNGRSRPKHLPKQDRLKVSKHSNDSSRASTDRKEASSTLPTTLDLTRSTTTAPQMKPTTPLSAPKSPADDSSLLLDSSGLKPGTSAFSNQWRPISNLNMRGTTSSPLVANPSNSSLAKATVEQPRLANVTIPSGQSGSQSPFAMSTSILESEPKSSTRPSLARQPSGRNGKLVNVYHSNGANQSESNFESHRVSRNKSNSEQNRRNQLEQTWSSTLPSVGDTKSALGLDLPRRTQDPFAFETLRSSEASTQATPFERLELAHLDGASSSDNSKILIRKKLFLEPRSSTSSSTGGQPAAESGPFGNRRATGDAAELATDDATKTRLAERQPASARCQYFGCKSRESQKFVCLNETQICDDFIDCQDESDELDCVSLLKHDHNSPRLSFSNGDGIIYLNRRGSLAPLCIDYFDPETFDGHELGAIQLDSATKQQELVKQVNTIGQYACSLQSFSKLISVKINHHRLVDDSNLIKQSKLFHRLSIISSLDKRNSSRLSSNSNSNSETSFKSATSEHEIQVSSSSECPSQRTVFVKCGSFECGQDSFSVMDSQESRHKSAVINDFPWLVKLYWLGSLSCHGYLVDEMWLISSAECFAKRRTNADSWTAEISYEHYGNHDYQSIESNRRVISEIIMQTGHQDNSAIVLAKLERPVRFSPLNRPICLPLAAMANSNNHKESSNSRDEQYKNCVTATLPLAAKWAPRQELLLSKVHFHKLTECLSPVEESSSDLVCVSEPSLAETATSGDDNKAENPSRVLICSTSQSARSRSKWTVVGFEARRANESQAGRKQLYTTVSSQIDWIVDTMNPRSSRNVSSQAIDPSQSESALTCSQFKCSTGECLGWSRICDGLYDCSSHEDEIDCHR